MKILLGFALSIFLWGCSQQPVKSPKPIAMDNKDSTIQSGSLSYGMIKKHLSVGNTTQADVLRLFGSPNNMTISSNDVEIWVYDRVRTETSSSSEKKSAGGAIGSAINNAGIVIGGYSSSSSSNMTSSTNTLTVIIEFDKAGTLMDYSARQGRY